MSDPIQNFELVLKKQSVKRPLGLYSANKQPNKHNLRPQDVISSVSMQLKAIQVADSVKSEKKDLQKYKKSKLLSVNKVPVYDEVPKQRKFDTQCVSDTQLINVIEDAEMIDVHRGMTQEFETTFCHHTEKQDVTSDEKTDTQVCVDSDEIICKDIDTVGGEKSNEITENKPKANKNIEADVSLSIISPIMFSNKTKDVVGTVNKPKAVKVNKNMGADVSFSIISPIVYSNKTKDAVATVNKPKAVKVNKNIEADVDLSIISPIISSNKTKDAVGTVNKPKANIEAAVRVNKNIDADESLSIISPIMCSNKTKDAVHTQNSLKNYTQVGELSPIDCIEIEDETNTSIERPLSPIFLHKHVKVKSKTPSPLTFNLEKFEQFQKIAIPMIDSNDLITAKHVIDSQILDKELLVKMDEEIELNERKVLSPVLQNKNVTKDSPTSVGFESSTFKDADTDIEFIELDKVTSDGLVNKVLNENVATKVRAESEILKDEILFSSDEEDGYVHKEYTDLPFTCALETSFYNQSDVLDKTMYVGFQTASNKTIQIRTESFVQAKTLLSDVSPNEITVTDLVKNCDSYTKSKTQIDENQAKIDTEVEENEFKLTKQDDNKELNTNADHTVTDFKGFTTASNKEIKLSDVALARCKKVFQDIDFSENFDDEIKIKNTISKTIMGHSEDVKETTKENMEDKLLGTDKESKLEPNNNNAVDDMQNIDDDIMQEFENIEMSLDEDKATESSKDIKISETALSKIKDVFNDIDFDEELRELDVKENTMSKISNGNFEGFKTGSNKKINISNEAITKTKNLFQDVDATDFLNKSINNLKPSMSEASFVGFKTANNKDIKISDEALAKTKSIFKDIESTDFNFPIRSDKDDSKVNINDQSPSNTSFLSFKTANNNDIIISKESLAKTKNIFKDIDSVDIETYKKSSNKNISDKDEQFLVVNPSTSNTNHIGYKTASNKAIKISDAALATTKKIFKDIDSAQGGRISNEVEMNEIETKKINEFETIASNPMNIKSKFEGFKTANNRNIKISDAALTKVKDIFKDIDNVEFQSQPSKEFQDNITENKDKDINDIKNIVPVKFSTTMANFTGFKTANNKKINISEAALTKSRQIFKDINSDHFSLPEKSNKNLDGVELLQEIGQSSSKYMIDFNQPSTSKACFISFKTANKKKINISEESLAKTKNIFKDIDSNDFVFPKKHTKELQETGKHEKDQLILQSEVSFKGFRTGNNKAITVSEAALAKTKNIFKDIDSSEQLPEKNIKDYPNMERNIDCPSLINKANFIGFKTGNNKAINVSELALAKSKNIFKDIDSTEFQFPDKNKKDYPYLEKYTDSSMTTKDKSITISKNTTTKNNNVNILEDTMPKFQGFQTASNKQVKVSDDALAKSRKLFQDIDCKIEDVRLLNTVSENIKDKSTTINKTKNNYTNIPETTMPKFQGFQTASNKQVKVSDEALAKSRKLFQDIDSKIEEVHVLNIVNSNLNVKESIGNTELTDRPTSPVFKGFQTANKKPVNVCKDTLAKSRKLFQDIDDFEPEFHGFKTPNDESSVNALTQVNNLIKDKIKENMSVRDFQSEDDLVKSRKLFRDIDKKKHSNENIKFGFKTGTNRDIVISEKALAKSNRLFSEIEENHTNKNKDKMSEENIDNIIDTQVLNNFEESLHTEDFHETPVKSKRSGSPILSCPKAKRRKKFETPYSQKIPKPEIKKEIITKKVNTITFNVDYKKNKKFSLKDLVNKSTSNIDPYLLQFKLDDILQFEFRDSRSDLSYDNMTIGSLKALFVNSVNNKLIPNGWLDNHLKLILWKLISYEIKCSSVVCSARNVVDQLKYRYDKELYNAQRPALRKILEKDDVPSKTIVLCVAGIFVDGVQETSPTTTNNIELLLTDGWYCIKATLDRMLAQLVCQGKIVVGTKLATNGAELVNCEQGISPWEDTSAVRLKIFGNSTRRARWDSRLGYHGNGAILSQLSSVRLDGGKVSKLRVYVTRVYPALYVEKFEDGSTVTRSERLEHVHQMKSEAERQAIMEKIYEEVEKEFSDQESQDSEGLSGSGNKRTCLDSGSQIAKVMKMSKDPAEFRSELTSSQTRLLEDHTSKRRERLLQDIQKRIRDKVEKAGVVVNRNVVTLLKIRVAGVMEKNGVEVTKGMMSIWKPTDAVLEIIKEGAWIDVMNVVPTAVRYSEIQISAGRQSVFSVSKYKEPENFKPYTKLLNRKCFTIKELANNPSMSTDYNEIDTVGFIFLIDPSIQDFDSNKQPFQNVFLADSDMNIICINFWGGLKKFGFQNVLDTGQIVACTNLQKRAGNTRKTIPQYRVTELSYFTKTHKNENARIILDDLSKKFLSLDRRKFSEDCVVLKNNYSLIKHNNNENISPYRFNNSDYNISKHKMFIDSPLVRPKTIDDNFNLTGLDFESTFRQTDTQNLSEEMLQRKKKVNEKIARLKMYGEPPPLSTIHIINRSKNASSSYKSPLTNNNSKIISHYSKIEWKPPYSISDSSTNVASAKNTPEKCVNADNVTCSPVLLNRTYVKSVNPVKINFDVKDDNDSTFDHFAEEFDASPPLSLD